MIMKKLYCGVKAMNEKSWNDFEKTGKISDYLNYKLSNENIINQKIKEVEELSEKTSKNK